MTINREAVEVTQADRDAAAVADDLERIRDSYDAFNPDMRAAARSYIEACEAAFKALPRAIEALTTRIGGSGLEEDGRSPLSAGRATQASPEAPAGLRHSVSVPSAVAALRRCLLPVQMGMAQAELVDEPLPDDAVVLHFMGSGASDQVTAGEVRAALALSVLTVENVRLTLRAACNGNQAAWAEKNGVSPQYVSDVLAARREPGESILAAIGLARSVAYVPTSGIEARSDAAGTGAAVGESPAPEGGDAQP